MDDRAFSRAHSKWLDPPDPPVWGECERCGREVRYDDMQEFGEWENVCVDCVDELGDEIHSEETDEVVDE